MSKERARSWLFATALTIGLALSTSCGQKEGPIRDARAEAAASAAQRLQGRWVLVSYQSETPLEPVLQMLLNAQFEHLVADFNGERVVATGPGVTVNRVYRVQEAYGDHFKATVIDQFNVGTDVTGDFSGNLLLLSGITAPWRGRGTLRRLQ